VIRRAHISKDGRYRYMLWRCWAQGRGKMMLFVMLNPSTANAEEDDPTIRRCIGFANRNECKRLLVGNLFAYRATDPSLLRRRNDEGIDVEGPENQAWLWDMASDADYVVCGWGASVPRSLMAKAESSIRTLRDAHEGELYCLGKTSKGHPRHPLYLPNASELVVL